MEQENFEKQY